jgi:DNA repair protein RecO (recombination protein O)
MDLGEADRIITFLTRRRGMIRAVASGARRLRNRLGGKLQLFTHGALVYFAREGSDLARINEFEPLHMFPSLRSDLDRLSYGSYLLELSSQLLWQGEVAEDAFSLLLRSLLRLEKGVEAFHVEKGFESRLLGIAGYAPDLERCLKCKRLVGDDSLVRLLPEEGGIVCPDCSDHLSQGTVLSATSRSYLRQARSDDMERLQAVNLSPSERKEISQALRSYLDRILQKRLRTLLFRDQLQSSPPPPGEG